MSWETFKACIDKEENNLVSLGGGEPTLHQSFEKFLLYAISKCEVWLATNGSQTAISLTLAKLAKYGIISCSLSQDQWHNSIDQKVVKAFTKNIDITSYNSYRNDLREIRRCDNPVQSGRCSWGVAECPCDDLFVKPNGNIYWCGCSNAPKLGNIISGYDLRVNERNYENEYGECWNK